MPSVERFDDTDLSALSHRRPDGSDSVECSICLAHLLPSEVGDVGSRVRAICCNAAGHSVVCPGGGAAAVCRAAHLPQRLRTPLADAECDVPPLPS